MAAERVLALAHEPDPPVFVLCDGDLGETARQLPALVDAVRSDSCDLAIASFARRKGGGFGIALGLARWVVQRLVGLHPRRADLRPAGDARLVAPRPRARSRPALAWRRA